MDALSELLNRLRLGGTAFIDALLKAPWSIQTPSAAVLDRILHSHARAIPFHMVVAGSCRVEVEGSPPVELGPKELVAFPHGDVHILRSAAGLAPYRISDEDAQDLVRPGRPSRVKFGGAGPETHLICGFFSCDRLLAENLVLPLPRVLTFRPGSQSAAMLLPSAVAAARASNSKPNPEPGADAMMRKLCELVFIEAIRSYALNQPATSDAKGWIGAMHVPMVRQCLGIIHSQPDQPWTLSSLARVCSASPSALSQRFTRSMGESPIEYLSSWRLRLAASELQRSEKPIKQLANEAGYASVEAFTRAFRRTIGTPPAQWRTRAVDERAQRTPKGQPGT
jgi:AraC-like DNA-binding protein